jgi:hypothetical protein
MRTKKGDTIMNVDKQLLEQMALQDQELNVVSDQELEVITGGSAREGAVGGAVLGTGVGAAKGVGMVKKYNAKQKMLESGKRVSGKGKIGAAIGGAVLGAGMSSAVGAAYGAVGKAILKK